MSLLVQELFDYPTNAVINTKNGGTGWGGAWTGTASCQTYTNNHTYAGISDDSPTYAKRLIVYNEGSQGCDRDFASAISNVNGNTLWFATSFGTDVNKTIPFMYLKGLTTDGSTVGKLFTYGASFANPPVVKAMDGTVFFNGTYGTGVCTPHSFVVKIEMLGGTSCTVRWYINVDLNTDPTGWTEKTSASWKFSSITGWAWSAGGTATTTSTDYAYFDNIRLATTSYEAGGYASPNASTSSGSFFPFF